jgi:zinc transport system substrate-binding protein
MGWSLGLFTIPEHTGSYNEPRNKAIPTTMAGLSLRPGGVSAARIALLAFLAAVITGCRASQPDGARFMATIPPLQMILQEIVGPGEEVACILPPGASPHTFELRPSIARKAARARAVFYVDASIDGWATRLATPNLCEVFSTLPANLRLPYEVEHVHGESHGTEEALGDSEHAVTYNAHFWLDPLAVQAIVPFLVEMLSKANPEGAAQYQANGARFITSLQALHEELDAGRPGASDYALVAFHPSWSYFFHRYGVRVSGFIEPFPGREPTPQAMEALNKLLTSSNNRIVLSEVQLPAKPAEVLAEMFQTDPTVLDPLGGSGEMTTYAALLRVNARRLWKAFP